MKNKLYLAVMWALSGAVAGDAVSAVDLFNNPVGAIGVKKTQPDLFNNPVGAIGSQAKVPVVEKKVLAEANAPQSKKSSHWSYQPVRRPADPELKDKSWVRNPIDAFVLAKLEAKGLKPSPDADRAAFIRRATLDAWGVIP
ncbi:MAG: DUF1549 domain-containing protein, partial [Methylovulum sp.]